MLEIKVCIITIDVMGCQTNIAENIIEKQAGYVLAVQYNQKSLHWMLDLTIREDDSPIRAGYAPENFNIIRQLAINLLKRESSQMSIKKSVFRLL